MVEGKRSGVERAQSLKIGDKVRVKNCGFSYHSGEEGFESKIIRIDKSKSFPVKLEGGNCYLEQCLEKII